MTPEGFRVKKARLDFKYTDKEEGDSSSVAETLAKPTSPTREKLMHLFKSKIHPESQVCCHLVQSQNLQSKRGRPCPRD